MSDICGEPGGTSEEGEFRHPGRDCSCARPVGHPLRDIPLEDIPIPCSHRCSCGEVWIDPSDVLYA